VPEDPQAPQLELLFEARIDLEPPEDIGETPFGRRLVFIVREGTFEGPRLRGTFLPGGGDWYLVRGDGAGELDVRATLRTDDGALVLVTYRGVLEAPPEVTQRVMRGEDVSSREYYFRTAPRFETGAKDYAWLNTCVTVATGWFGRNVVGYSVYTVR
jgi:hypothetical protein